MKRTKPDYSIAKVWGTSINWSIPGDVTALGA